MNEDMLLAELEDGATSLDETLIDRELLAIVDPNV